MPALGPSESTVELIQHIKAFIPVSAGSKERFCCRLLTVRLSCVVYYLGRVCLSVRRQLSKALMQEVYICTSGTNPENTGQVCI